MASGLDRYFLNRHGVITGGGQNNVPGHHSYRGRNVVERSFNKLKQWRGIAMRSDKTARNYHSALCLASALHWVRTLPHPPSERLLSVVSA